MKQTDVARPIIATPSFKHKRPLINAPCNNQVDVSKTIPVYKSPGRYIHEQQRKVVLLRSVEYLRIANMRFWAIFLYP